MIRCWPHPERKMGKKIWQLVHAASTMFQLPKHASQMLRFQNFRCWVWLMLAWLHSVFAHLDVHHFNFWCHLWHKLMPPPQQYSSTTSNPSFSLPIQSPPYPKKTSIAVTQPSFPHWSSWISTLGFRGAFKGNVDVLPTLASQFFPFLQYKHQY